MYVYHIMFFVVFNPFINYIPIISPILVHNPHVCWRIIHESQWSSINIPFLVVYSIYIYPILLVLQLVPKLFPHYAGFKLRPIIFQRFSPLLLDYFAIVVSTFRLFHGFSIMICW